MKKNNEHEGRGDDLLAVANLGPNWAPLRAKLGDEGCKPFMFMASYPVAGTVIHSYKHRDTRRYLNIDEDGKCYTYRGGYTLTTNEKAFNHVFG